MQECLESGLVPGNFKRVVNGHGIEQMNKERSVCENYDVIGVLEFRIRNMKRITTFWLYLTK